MHSQCGQQKILSNNLPYHEEQREKLQCGISGICKVHTLQTQFNILQIQ